MSELFKEDLLSIVRKKRFIVLAALAFIGVIAATIVTRNGQWNDLTYFLMIQKYINFVFGPVIGIALIISVYRRKYTKNSILQVEEKGAKRPLGVISKALAGSFIIVCSYACLALIVILLGFVLGAHNSGAQIGHLLLRVLIDCFASIATYMTALFWLYVFAFPIVPVIMVIIEAFAVPYAFYSLDIYASPAYKIATYLAVKANTDSIYTNLVLKDVHIANIGIYVLHLIIPFLFAMLVFKLKKIKQKKNKKNKNNEENEQITETSEPDAS